MEGRRIKPLITYEGKDISKDIAPYLKSLSYSDELSGKADDLQIVLEDREGLWQSDWFPEKGDGISVTLQGVNWQGNEELKLGSFEVDEISAKGWPTEVTIKATSVPENTKLRDEGRSRSWEKVKLSKIAGDIAAEADLQLVYDTDEDPTLERAEQTDESDLNFLLKLTQDKGLALKIHDGQLVIFDEEEYEKQDSIMTITKEMLSGYSFNSKIRDVYAACHVKYAKSKNKSVIEATFKLDGKEGKTLQVNEEVESVAEAEKLAKKKLREKNADEVTGSLSMMGDFELLAAVCVDMEGFGKFDGKYIVTSAKHSIGSGYKTSIEVRRCLDGY